MAHLSVGREASSVGGDAGRYERHPPEQALLYQLVEQHYPRFLAELEARGQTLPHHVQREFEDYLKCGRLEHGFHFQCFLNAAIQGFGGVRRIRRHRKTWGHRLRSLFGRHR